MYRWKLTWLALGSGLTLLTVVDFSHLIKKKKLEDADVFEENIDYDSVRLRPKGITYLHL